MTKILWALGTRILKFGHRKSMKNVSKDNAAFSLIEVLVSLLIISILVSILVPSLMYARDASRTVLCSANLRQTSIGWRMYVDDNRQFPQYTQQPDWHYGGADFVGADHRPRLDPNRPINEYLVDENAQNSSRIALLFRCPSDSGVFIRDTQRQRYRRSILNDQTCFEFFGTSYRANMRLLDSTEAGYDKWNRPLTESQIFADPSRLLLMGDAAWFYATSDPDSNDAALEASWHNKPDAGNMLAVDGSVRFLDFTESSRFTIDPRK